MHAALLTAFLFALTGVCATQSSRLLGGGCANFWRLVVALLILTMWAHTLGNGFGGGVLGWFLVAGAVGFGLGGWCMFQALRRAGSTLSLLVVECAAAVFASALGWIWLGAALTLPEMLFAGLILMGVIVGVSPGPIPSLDRATVMAGALLALAAAFFQAISFNVSRRAFTILESSGGSLDHLTAAYQRLLGGALVALLLYGITRHFFPPPAKPASPAPRSPLPAPVWVLLNALFGPVLGVSCMLWAIRLVPNPGLVQAVAASATLMTIPFAFGLENARPRWNYYLGSLLALGGTTGLLLKLGG